MPSHTARPAEGPAESPARLRVATLNCGATEPDWDARAVEIAAWLDALRPDVACLQEVLDEAHGSGSVADVLAALSSGPWHSAWGGFGHPHPHRPGETVPVGSAVLSRWPVEHAKARALPVDDCPPSDHEAYGLQMELLHARTAGLDVFSTHLAPPLDQGYLRVRQARAIDASVRECRAADSPLPPILCGDLNAEPDSEEIRYLSGLASIDGDSTYYQDAWRVAGEGPGLTWDGSRNPMAAQHPLPARRVDYVLVGDPMPKGGRGLVSAARVAFDEPLTGVLASDHFGVVADLRWQNL